MKRLHVPRLQAQLALQSAGGTRGKTKADAVDRSVPCNENRLQWLSTLLRVKFSYGAGGVGPSGDRCAQARQYGQKSLGARVPALALDVVVGGLDTPEPG